ncbi:hypothetical protein [Novipirellula rosea]|uniref:Uncharacterized protein n=1 Tax=Novipirellula rosea TaxID=1031540 RepID=A0ABP8ND85_9BACT
MITGTSTNDAEFTPIVHLSPEVARVTIDPAERMQAIAAAYWITASPHEHVWTADDQRLMAQYVLWANQKLSAIEQVVAGDLSHAEWDDADPS